MKQPPLVYLAAPYSHESAEVREERARAATNFAARLTARNGLVFSPITHSHPIAKLLPKVPLYDNHWLTLDKRILMHCDRLAVLRLPGWEASKGVTEEINMANALNIPITYV